jgi:Domain of unknown function (DUF4386)
MANAPSRFSPRPYARAAGILYLLLILAGGWAQVFVRGTIIVAGDATATAANIMASESLWRAGIAADLLMHLCDVPVMLILYLLLKPTSRHLALLALLFNLVQTAVLVANKITLLIPLFLLGNAPYLKALGPQQLSALAYVSLRVHDYGYGCGLIFFGFVCLIEGYLIRRSGYLPRILGTLMQVAGGCYLANSFALLLAPALAATLFPAIMLPPLITELALAIWLVGKGVDVQRWEDARRLAG